MPPGLSQHRKYTRQIKEGSFQYRIIQLAEINGWKIDLSHTQITREDGQFADTLNTFLRGKLAKVRDFLLSRKKPVFTLAYHTHDSRRSQPGFPDLILIHPDRQKMLAVELKRDGEYPRLEQRLWLAAFTAVAQAAPHALEVHVWSPKDYEKAVEVLGGLDVRLFL